MAITNTDHEDQPHEIKEAAALYEEYGKPLEQTHRGEYLAVSKDGKTLLAPTLLAAVEEAAERFGPDNFVFKVGDQAVGTWLCLQPAL